MEDSTHLMRRYMRTLMPDHPQTRKFACGGQSSSFSLHKLAIWLQSTSAWVHAIKLKVVLAHPA